MIVLDLVQLKKDRTDVYEYQQVFMEIRGTMITLLFTQMVQRDGNAVACASFSIKHHNFHCLTQHPYLLLKFGQSLKPWSKLKILLHPNTLSCLTAVRHCPTVLMGDRSKFLKQTYSLTYSLIHFE